MIAPVSLASLIAADPVQALKAAIVARLGALMPGVKIVSHPGRIDIADVVAKSVVAAPGVAVGWTRIRARRLIDGGYGLAVEFAAYVVVEDAVVDGRRVERETLGLALGHRLLAILEDADAQTWGLGNVLPPEADPAPELKPMFTVRDAAAGAAYYAVTWTQLVADLGRSLFASDRPAVTELDGTGIAPFADVTFPDQIPPEVLALLRQERA
ncbi:unknown protein [Azorhizobium caulinodans ORS 571]|uniref:Uncharacterized protein n=1 Tax=Azorhizobium caulinodans (strain ATCC 43989 / DSM 5975 / JCM 20966 / LMG 6465 / NBRC 14845 / NCIMB 13405 / ORS 571) TaxID=438753 RepID=A8I7R5_AZOC5|nr:hypothetical protein [Azorhizobium caulinodans]BAF88151.1 unknown protein [Azorhizobium caulinodans ORS 571]